MESKNYAEMIKNEYVKKEETKTDRLRSLDRKAKRPSVIIASVYGTVSALILGVGMCMCMDVLWPGNFWWGVGIGTVGILLCCGIYFVYDILRKKGMEKYKNEILTLSEEILNEKENS